MPWRPYIEVEVQNYKGNFWGLLSLTIQERLSNLLQFTTKRWSKLYDLSFSLWRGLQRDQRWPFLYGQFEETSKVPFIILILTSTSIYGLHSQVCKSAWTSLILAKQKTFPNFVRVDSCWKCVYLNTFKNKYQAQVILNRMDPTKSIYQFISFSGSDPIRSEWS